MWRVFGSSRKRWLTFSTTIAGIVLFPMSLIAGPAEEEIFASFEALCINNLNNQTGIPNLISSLGGKLLPDHTSRTLLGSQKGKAWFYKTGKARFSLVLTEKGVCAIGADVDGKIVKTLFEKNSNSSILSSEKLGSQEQTVYDLTQEEPSGGVDIRAVVMITTSNLESIDSVFLNAIPERLAVANGIIRPRKSEFYPNSSKNISGQCSLSEQQKAHMRKGMCTSIEYGNFKGKDCIEQHFRERAQDTGIQVELAQKCGFWNEGQELEELSLSALPYVISMNKCIDVPFDTSSVFYEAFESGKNRAKHMNCSISLKSKLRSRLPELIKMGRKNIEIGKKLNRKFGIQ